MKGLKALFTRILFPSGVLLAFLVPFSAGGLLYAVFDGMRFPVFPLACAVTAYTLVTLIARIPILVRFIISVQKNNHFVHKFTTDPFLRIRFSLPMSIIFDILYALVQLVHAIINMSLWFYGLVGYYIGLAVIRMFLLREFKPVIYPTKTKGQIRHFVGISLLLMNIALSVMVIYIVKFDRGFTTGWLFSLIIVSYTIGALITATVGCIKYRNLNSPALSISKVVNLVAAAVSVLVLETTLFDTFGGPGELRRTITAVTGGVVCFLTLVLALYLTIAGRKSARQREFDEDTVISELTGVGKSDSM